MKLSQTLNKSNSSEKEIELLNKIIKLSQLSKGKPGWRTLERVANEKN